METINNLLSYIFTPNPGAAFSYYWLLIALIVIFTGLGIAIKFYIRKTRKQDKAFKKAFRDYPAKLFILAFLFALYTVARWYSIGFFSMRFILYILLIATVYLIYRMVMKYLNVYPEEKKRREERSRLNKYIPGQNKKH